MTDTTAASEPGKNPPAVPGRASRHPGEAPSGPRPVPKWLAFFPLLSAPLLWLGYHPADQGWIAYFALAPWFCFLILETRVRRACSMTFWTWMLFFTIGLNWLRYTTSGGFTMIAFILGLEMFAFAWFARRWLARRNDAWAWLALGAMFTGWEYMRVYLMGGFPWFMVGHTQHAYLPLMQAADIGGVPLVGLPSCLTSALIGGMLATRIARHAPEKAGDPHFRRNLALCWSLAALLLAGLSGYGVWRLKTLPHRDSLNVGIVQANIPQEVKENPYGERTPRDIFNDHEKLSREVAQQSDVILWAETMDLFPITPDMPENRRAIAQLSKRLRRPVLIGVVIIDPDKRMYNSALLAEPTGEVVARYDKRHLVIVAEFMPFAKLAPWLHKGLHDLFEKVTNIQGFGGLTEGESVEPMTVRGQKMGPLICFDSMWSDESREYAEKGADFLACLSNDGWFHETEQLDQILAVAKFRAIENRIGIARCTNTGISAFISPDGRVKQFEVDGKVKSVRGATVGRVSGHVANTLFTAWGDWVGKGCLLLVGVLALFGPRKRPSPEAPSTPPTA